MGYNPDVDFLGPRPPKMDPPARVLFRRLQFSVTADQIVCRTIVFEFERGFAFQFGNNSLGEHLAQLDAPLIK
jgi:hypothetical protein